MTPPDEWLGLYCQTHNGYGDPYATVFSLSDSVLALDRLRQRVRAPYRALHPGSPTQRPTLQLHGVPRGDMMTILPPAVQLPTPIDRMQYEQRQWNTRQEANVHDAFFKGGERAR